MPIVKNIFVVTTLLFLAFASYVRGLSDEQVALYVARLEKDIGTSINEAAFAQATGAGEN